MLLDKLLPALSSSPPIGLPLSGNTLWFSSPASVWSSSLPVGNGYLAAMTPGGTVYEALQLNIESLWSGGPFQDPSYNGGNKQPSERDAMAEAMANIRRNVFQNGTVDDISVLTTDQGAYGSYAGSGYLVTIVNSSSPVSDYARYLDMDSGLAKVIWTQSDTTYARTTFCSNPSRSCTQHINSTIAPLPAISFAFSSELQGDLPTPEVICSGNDTLVVRGQVGMTYELVFRVSVSPANVEGLKCEAVGDDGGNSTITVKEGVAQQVWITWVGDTEYSMDAGDQAHDFSFKGVDPHDALIQSSFASYDDLLAEHINDYSTTFSSFQISLGQSPDLSAPTDVLKSSYSNNNPYLEWLTFNFGRYLLQSSTRSVLPSNLQGKWAGGTGNPWGADYRERPLFLRGSGVLTGDSNINIQMNYWAAEMTFGLNSPRIVRALFDYIEESRTQPFLYLNELKPVQKTWIPRGQQTADVLYNISRGWVTHNEMNIFGHTGMKGIQGTAQWADYPESGVWMMVHVWDHFDFTGDLDWFKRQGWPLLKSAAQFHLDKLIPDLHFNDSTLVVNPCNSPEQPPITFGCAHAQQLIWQLFNSIEKGYQLSGDVDTAFLDEVKAKHAVMDKGIHIGSSFGQLQEWKFEMDNPDDTHRHLSHLIGLFPGYAIASYDQNDGGNYTREAVLEATQISLIHRGNGTGGDADAGWEKVWRAGAWAQLGNADTFYNEITYALARNFGPTLLSLYNPQDPDPIFQIDANLGYTGALMNALVQVPDVASYDTPLLVTLLPALPSQWSAHGYIKGVRLRAGIVLDLEWEDGKPTTLGVSVPGPVHTPRRVKVIWNGDVLLDLVTSEGLVKHVSM